MYSTFVDLDASKKKCNEKVLWKFLNSIFFSKSNWKKIEKIRMDSEKSRNLFATKRAEDT